MTPKFRNTERKLFDPEDESGMESHILRNRKKPSSVTRNFIRGILFLAFIITFLFYLGTRYNFKVSNPFSPVIEAFQQAGQPSEELLDGMRNMLVEMGYENMTNEQLIELRNEGVTATYVSRVRELGYEDLTLDDAIRLQQAGVSTTFMTMMQELGYENVSIEDYIRLRRSGVTAYFTSNVHDLGYRDVTIEQLIRMQQIGVTVDLIRRLQEENENVPSLDEIIRYRISNQ